MANVPVKRLFGRMNVINVTSARTLTRDESGSFVHNAGASAEVPVTLPEAEAGLYFDFKVMAAQNLKIVAASGDTIRVGTGSAGSAGGNISADAVGESIRFIAVNATEWHTDGGTAAVGTWTAA